MVKDKVEIVKEEFCLNSKRYITTMALKGQPPKSCPRQEDNFSTCEYCGYYELRAVSKYKVRKDNILKSYGE
jgi:hypothetical protein